MKIHDCYQPIITKSIGPSNTKGSRISASAAAGRIIRTRSYEGTEYEQHKEVALELCNKFGWNFSALVGSQTKDGNFVWLQIVIKD